MANAGTTVRRDLHNLSSPLQVRELNRQLEWLWKQLLGGLTQKAFSDDGVKQIVNTVEKTIAAELEASEVDTNVLKAALIEAMVSQIGVADIDYAQIVDGFMTRLFVDDTLAGKIRCERLLLNSAQIADLEVGAFRLVSATGEVYKIDVDSNGALTTQYLYDQDAWFTNGAPPDGYSAIVSGFNAGEVTTGTLYVTGEASFLKVISKCLEADTAYINSLFASEAAIAILNTYDIRNDDCITLSVNGERRTYLRVRAPGVEIGEENSANYVQITPDALNIVQRGAGVIAYFAKNLAWMLAAEVRDYLRIGQISLRWSDEEGLIV